MRELYNAALPRANELTLDAGQLVRFRGVEGFSVYNATAPKLLPVNGKLCWIIAGRVERLSDIANSRIMFFRKTGVMEYTLIPNAPVFPGEDPAITIIGGEIVLTSVAVYPLSNGGHLVETENRRARDVMELGEGLWLILDGKDVRFLQIGDGDNPPVAVMSRPQGGEANLGTPAYSEFRNLNDVSAERVRNAPLTRLPKASDTWAGVNEMHRLPGRKKLFTLMHGAFKGPETAEVPDTVTYFPVVALFNPDTLEFTNIRVLAVRKNFPADTAENPAKRRRLENVVFPAGLELLGRYARLHVGVGDSGQATVLIRNPLMPPTA